MVRSFWDQITFVVRDAQERTVILWERVKIIEARQRRKELEANYESESFRYEILEFITEEQKYLTELSPASRQWSTNSQEKVEKKAQESLKTTQVNPVVQGRRLDLEQQLKQALEERDVLALAEAGKILEEEYWDQKSVRKKVGLAYSSLKETRRRGIEILELVGREHPDAETYLALANAYASEQRWAESAQNYDRAGNLEGEEAEKVKAWLAAAYMLWLNHQNDDAVKVAQRALDLAEKSGKQELIQLSKNSLSYYWAETGQNLDTALAWCLEILGVPNDEHFVGTLEKRALRQQDGPIVDTLGRVVEALGKPLDAFRLYRKANQTASHAVNIQNLERAHRKLRDEINQ